MKVNPHNAFLGLSIFVINLHLKRKPKPEDEKPRLPDSDYPLGGGKGVA